MLLLLQHHRGVTLALAAFLAAVPMVARAQEGLADPSGPDDPAPHPKLLLKGFGNVDYLLQGDEAHNAFTLGQLDLFITSELTEGLSVLSEIVFEKAEEPGKVHEEINVERLQIRYSFSDEFNVVAGRMHTVLGYWNETYHHGAWFQTTASRPDIYQFDDLGGVLPIHEVGVQLLGAATVSKVRVEYNLSVANGRGRVPNDIATSRDDNSRKALNAWLSLSPADLRELRVGGVIHDDRIPPDPDRPGRGVELDERIVGGFAIYRRARAEALFEVLRLRHRERGGGRTFRTWGLYAQAARAFGRFKPYYRFDRLDVAEEDPFYVDSGPDVRKHTLGARFDGTTWAALILEVSHERRPRRSSFGTATLQISFTF